MQTTFPPSPAVAAATLSLVLVLTGCGGKSKRDEYQTSALSNLPFVYKMTVQQGNIVTEEMVDSLQPGMTKRQVQYLLGTPPLIDFFHVDRWNYTYTIQRGGKDMQVKRLILYFQDDALVQIEGDMQPNPSRAAAREPEDIVVEVPDFQGRKGLVRRSLRAVGL